MSTNPNRAASSSDKGKALVNHVSSSDSSQSRSPPGQVDFEFLNFSHPSDAKASGARRTVRSHVTRHQHQKEQFAAAAARRSRDLPQSSGAATQRNPPRLRTQGSSSLPETEASSPVVSPLMTSSSEHSSLASTATSPLHSPLESQSGRLDPFDLYPEQWHSSIPVIIEFYLNTVATDNIDLDGPNNRGLLRSVWFPFVLTDVTLLHSVMLLAANHCSSVRGLDSHSIDTHTLKSIVISGINEALQTPAKSVSDELIGAVLTLASYEALFGDSEAYTMHMNGLQRIVELRGGLGALGLGGLLERMLLWTDSNASNAVGFDVFFAKTRFPSDVQHPVPNPSQFGARRPSNSRSW